MTAIGIVDVFSGPGGLAEGFHPVSAGPEWPFRIAVSIEKDPAAHETLLLRSFLRKFDGPLPVEYYDLLNGRIDAPDWGAKYPDEWQAAQNEAKCLELGDASTTSFLEGRIGEIRDAYGTYSVLIGGPPCQAYSLAGRVRNAAVAGYLPHRDQRHLLYQEYVKVLGLLEPAFFIMENVKGMLSASLRGEGVFKRVKLSTVDSDRAEEIVPKISEYANSQNRINAADFFANHPFHVRMEEFSRRLYAPSPDGEFRETKWFYERARGQYQDARGSLTPAQQRRFDLEHPRKQLFTKTDLAKFVNVWRGHPDVVSLGAQKNFAQFAAHIGRAWEQNQDEFNEGWFRHAVAKAIVFRATERLVAAQPWYRGGYRANIVAYAIAKLGHDVAALERAVDFEVIWRRQAVSRMMAEALAGVGKEVHDVLIDPPTGISNVTEWAKKQACWSRVESIESDWASSLLPELITRAADRDAARSDRRDQRILNGIAIQKAVVEAGPAFWTELLQWGKETGSLTHKEASVLNVATRIPTKVPTEAQSKVAFAVARRLWHEGFPKALGAA